MMALSRIILARPGTQGISRLLFDMSLRGMGILNYRNDRESGETWFLGRLAIAAPAAGCDLVVLDVGANEGSYTERVLEVLPDADIHAFEPHPSTVAKLRARVGDRVTVVSAAAGAVGGTLQLFDYEDGDGSVHASPYRDVFEEIHKVAVSVESVPVRRLDDYLEDLGFPHVLLLKIDTEGHELEVLRGASVALGQSLVEVVQFEFNEMNVISRAFLRDFRTLLPNFEMFRLLPEGVVPLRGEPLEEVFAFQNIVAVRRGSEIRDVLL